MRQRHAGIKILFIRTKIRNFSGLRNVFNIIYALRAFFEFPPFTGAYGHAAGASRTTSHNAVIANILQKGADYLAKEALLQRNQHLFTL